MVDILIYVPSQCYTAFIVLQYMYMCIYNTHLFGGCSVGACVGCEDGGGVRVVEGD